MKICSQCGHGNDDDSSFCVVDATPLGAPAGRIVVPINEQQTNQAAAYRHQATAYEPAPKSARIPG